MEEKMEIKIKADDGRIPNKMHFEVQLSTRSNVFFPKKGKGSFRRHAKHKGQKEDDDECN